MPTNTQNDTPAGQSPVLALAHGSAPLKRLNRDEVIALLCDGWELGASDGRAWLQPKLCCGGKSHNIHMATFSALRRSGKIIALPKKRGDSFWLSRYGLPNKANIPTGGK